MVGPDSVEQANPQVPQLRVWARRHQHLAESLDERTETDASPKAEIGTALERRLGIMELWRIFEEMLHKGHSLTLTFIVKHENYVLGKDLSLNLFLFSSSEIR